MISQGFHPTTFCFPVPYSFAAAYGCGNSVAGCVNGGTGLANAITGGGPGADGGSGNFADLLIYAVDSQYARGKEFGSNAGAGMADTYLAYRLGTAATANLKPVGIGFTMAPGAAQARVTLTQPTGVVTRFTCSTSPCQITVDARLSDPLYQLDYISSTGSLVATGTQDRLKVH